MRKGNCSKYCGMKPLMDANGREWKEKDFIY